MRFRLKASIGLSALSIVLVSCIEQTSPSRSERHIPQNSVILHKFGPNVLILNPCQTPIVPNFTHVLTINNLNIRKLDNNKEEWKNSIPGNPRSESPPKTLKSTRWDIDLALKNGESALLRVELNDNGNKTLHFISDELAITAGDPSSQSSRRFCRIVRTSPSTTVAEIIAFHDPMMPTNELSSINIGINVKEKLEDFVTPIHIDPNVKNNG